MVIGSKLYENINLYRVIDISLMSKLNFKRYMWCFFSSTYFHFISEKAIVVIICIITSYSIKGFIEIVENRTPHRMSFKSSLESQHFIAPITALAFKNGLLLAGQFFSFIKVWFLLSWCNMMIKLCDDCVFIYIILIKLYTSIPKSRDEKKMLLL